METQTKEANKLEPTTELESKIVELRRPELTPVDTWEDQSWQLMDEFEMVEKIKREINRNQEIARKNTPLLEAVHSTLNQGRSKARDVLETKHVVVFKQFEEQLWKEIFDLAQQTGEVDIDISVAGKDFCILAFDTHREAVQAHTTIKAAQPQLQVLDITMLNDTDCNMEVTHTLFMRIQRQPQK